MQLRVFFVFLTLSYGRAEEAGKKNNAEAMHDGYGSFTFGGPVDLGQSFELKHNNPELSNINLFNGLGLNYISSFGSSYGSSQDEHKPEAINLGTQFHKRITVTRTFGKPFYSPSPMKVEKKEPVPVPRTIAVLAVTYKPVQMTKPFSVPTLKSVPFGVISPVRLSYKTPFNLKIPIEVTKIVAVQEQKGMVGETQLKKNMVVDKPVKKDYAIAVPLQKAMATDLPAKKDMVLDVPVKKYYAIPVPQKVDRAVTDPVLESKSAAEAATKKIPVFLKPFSVGSGSLGYVRLENGIYAIGSGSLGFSSAIGNTTPPGKNENMASMAMNEEPKLVVSLSNALPRNGAHEIFLDSAYESIPSDKTLTFGGFFNTHI